MIITLENLINVQKYTGDSDIDIIKAFFTQNDLEEEAMELIYQLTQSKLSKMKYRESIVKTWASHLPSKYLYENYDLDTANHLHNLELDYLSNGQELSESRLEWAKENVPNIKMPDVYFQPLIEYLDSKDIRFKGEKPIEDKIFCKNL